MTLTMHKNEVHYAGVNQWWAYSYSCLLLCLQRQVAKLASGLFYRWSLLRNNKMAAKSSKVYFKLEMARTANSPVFGPSAKVLKQSASNFFSDDVIPGRYKPLQSARQKFLFSAKFHNLTTNIFCCCSLHYTVLPTFRFTYFHANQ